MILLIAILIIGYKWRRTARFYEHGLLAIFSQTVAYLLFHDDYGLLAIWLHGYMGDSPWYLLIAIPALGFGWAVPIWLLFRGSRQPKNDLLTEGVSS